MTDELGDKIGCIVVATLLKAFFNVFLPGRTRFFSFV
jgi:hypothetical protein